MSRRLFQVVLCLSLLGMNLTGCSLRTGLPEPDTAFSDWKLANLRWLGAPTSDAAHSLIGVYTRLTANDLEIRLDFLDLATPLDFDTYIALQTGAGGSRSLPLRAGAGLAYNLLIRIPAKGIPEALDAQGNQLRDLAPRVADSPALDLMTIQINRANLTGNLGAAGLQVFLTAAGQRDVLNQTPPILPGDSRPEPAHLVMVFWDTLPSATPAQTLRRWGGAHTGPMGGRHGLSVLLQAAAENRIPLILADLAQPASLSGLKTVGGEDQLRRLALAGKVSLPLVAFGDPVMNDASLNLSQAASIQAGFPVSRWAFGAFFSRLPSQAVGIFARLKNSDHLLTWQGKRVLPLPASVYPEPEEQEDPQASPQGISLDFRRKLLAAALSQDPSRLVVAGGSLPGSTWGEFSVAPAAFAYLAAHPWIEPLAESDLATFPTLPVTQLPLPDGCRDVLCSPPAHEVTPYIAAGLPAPSGASVAHLEADLRERMATLQPGAFTRIAQQSYLALTHPTGDVRLAGLQANALVGIGYLVEVARWASKPYARSDCSSDLDEDGLNECVLSSANWFLVIKAEGARLVFAASLKSQWVGPTSQFAVGLSDPSEWKPQSGPGGDPGEIPGAFIQVGQGFETYRSETGPGWIRLTSPAGDVEKIFRLSPDGFQAQLTYPKPVELHLPVTLAPQDWQTSLPVESWLPAPELRDNQWTWQPAHQTGLQIRFHGASQLTSSSYLDSLLLMNKPENPNLAYPAGHFLPYPVGIIRFQGQKITVDFSASQGVN